MYGYREHYYDRYSASDSASDSEEDVGISCGSCGCSLQGACWHVRGADSIEVKTARWLADNDRNRDAVCSEECAKDIQRTDYGYVSDEVEEEEEEEEEREEIGDKAHEEAKEYVGACARILRAYLPYEGKTENIQSLPAISLSFALLLFRTPSL